MNNPVVQVLPTQVILPVTPAPVIPPPVIPPPVIPPPVIPPVIPPPVIPPPVIPPPVIPPPVIPRIEPQSPDSPHLSPIILPEPAEVPQVLSPVELFVDTVIAEQDADIQQEKEYLGYVKYLLNDESKYDIFARLFPKETCPGVKFRMPNYNSPNPVINPSEAAMLECIWAKERLGGSFGIYFTYKNHANMLWFDVENKIINRYDPQVPSESIGQAEMDKTIRQYFAKVLPDYMYAGNTLEDYQCVQGVRGQGRTYKSDYYCQDYSLLYAINRISGLNHEEASFALVARGEDVLIDLAELLRALAYRTRLELGQDIPERFVNWNPEAGFY